jgi:hypothetical protein
VRKRGSSSWVLFLAFEALNLARCFCTVETVSENRGLLGSLYILNDNSRISCLSTCELGRLMLVVGLGFCLLEFTWQTSSRFAGRKNTLTFIAEIILGGKFLVFPILVSIRYLLGMAPKFSFYFCPFAFPFCTPCSVLIIFGISLCSSLYYFLLLNFLKFLLTKV